MDVVNEEPTHTPVMSERVVALLAPALDLPGAILVDATLGLGGHSRALLNACPQAQLVGIDRDARALEIAAGRLAEFAGRTTFLHAVYDELPQLLAQLGLPHVHGVLFDLGVSSLQLDDAQRGFAYSYDAPLDMRMDPSSPLTAAEVVNTYSVAELTRVLRDYGEERFAKRIARAIEARRPFRSSAELVDAVRAAIPAPAQRTGGHPAKRTFQALRIEVNDELGAVRRALPAAIDALARPRPDRGDVLPVVGGPHRQARPVRAPRRRRPGGLPGRRPRTGAAAPHPRRGTTDRAGGGRESPGCLGAGAGR